jgi:clan AA aspartic protease (TIGR02281 family)
MPVRVPHAYLQWCMRGEVWIIVCNINISAPTILARKRQRMRTFFLTSALLWLLTASAHSTIYKWTDQNGKVHFTDNIWAIPPEYRQQAEERSRGATPTPRPGETPQIPPATLPAADAPESKHYNIPFRRAGSMMLVDVVMDRFLKSRLLVDTGATFTVISTAMARQLALNLDNAALIPLQSASGVFLAPLTKVKSIAVGEAIVQDVEVIVHDIAQGSTGGLLGMSFLDNFQVTINNTVEIITLSTLTPPPGETLFGGRPEDWWRRKFRFYRRQIESLEEIVAKKSSAKLAKSLRYFQSELETLERQASLAAVPRHWRY